MKPLASIFLALPSVLLPHHGHAQTAGQIIGQMEAVRDRCVEKFPDLKKTAAVDCLDFVRRDDVVTCLQGGDAAVCRDAAHRERVLAATGAKVAHLAKGPFARSESESCRARLTVLSVEGSEPDPRTVCEFALVFASLAKEIGSAEKRGTPYFELFQEFARAYRKYVSREGFQSVRWGERRRRVAKKLKTRPGVTITERRKIAGRDATIEYHFVNDKLAQVVVQLSTSSMQPELDVRAFDELERLLKRRYPDLEAAHDSDHSDDPLADPMEEVGGLGRTVRHGSRTLRTTRATRETEIVHTLWAVELRMMHQLDYRSSYLYPQLSDARKQSKADDL
ncbi:MAG: hypothetical protein RMA76_44120 [Deltaproteobacteria bacterium]|jgi:hypothetical protein